MNNKELIKLKYKIYLDILIKIILSIIILIIILFFADGILNDPLANIVNTIDPYLYMLLKSNKEIIVISLLCIIMCILIYFTVNKLMKYINILVNSIEKVFNKEDELINLPDNFKDIETKLNKIKFEALKNEQVAKDAEQRKNDLVMYLAHDLKTPLTSIIGYLTLLNESKDLPINLRAKYIGISLDKAQRLEELINEFFDITRFNLQNIILEDAKLNLSFMLKQLIDEYYPLFEKKLLKCNYNIEDDLFIMGDSNKLARVFDNIIKNAINYSYENTNININVAIVNKHIVLEFINEGQKIPKHKIDSIFEKFYRLDSSRSSQTGGSGLGLAIAKEIVELYNGTISAISSDEYTIFTVKLPDTMLIKT